jgi:hypothetical protein
MTSKPVAFLLADLGITQSHSRPHVSDDNPFSEAQFKTLNYRPDFPTRSASIEAARQHRQIFFPWYNDDHRHTGLGLHTPANVHYGSAEAIREKRSGFRNERSRSSTRDCSTLWVTAHRAQSFDTHRSVEQIRRMCRAFSLPGHMPPGLRGCRSLACVVFRSFAVACGQKEATGTARGSGGGGPTTTPAASTAKDQRVGPTPGPTCPGPALSAPSGR